VSRRLTDDFAGTTLDPVLDLELRL